MAIVVVIPQNTYSPINATTARVYDINFDVPADTKSLKIAFSCIGWPLGVVGSLTFLRPDGSSGGGTSFRGGALGKDGLLALSQSMSVSGPGETMAVGQWNAQVSVVQEIITAVTVERFT